MFQENNRVYRRMSWSLTKCMQRNDWSDELQRLIIMIFKCKYHIYMENNEGIKRDERKRKYSRINYYNYLHSSLKCYSNIIKIHVSMYESEYRLLLLVLFLVLLCFLSTLPSPPIFRLLACSPPRSRPLLPLLQSPPGCWTSTENFLGWSE